MILYHFTFAKHLDSILSAGLEPSADGVVWLTTDPETIYAAGLRNDEIVELGPELAHNCRIKLVIPSSDRRLINWGRLLRKQGGPEKVEFFLCNPYLGPERARRTIEDWYCYSGTVAADCFREIRTPERLIDTAGQTGAVR